MRAQDGAVVAAAVAARHEELAAILDRLSSDDFDAPSMLPAWNRLTIVCHLRYGAEASYSMTRAALAGKPAAFYPEGRADQRPKTLKPRPGEQLQDVVQSYRHASRRLDELWSTIRATDWQREVREPENNTDLGTIRLVTLALLRLTEIEVHGTDLGSGASSWSSDFVDRALPMRIRWLSSRRSNGQSHDKQVNGTWSLAATDGPTFLIRATEQGVSVSEDAYRDCDARIAGTKQELLAWLLGRINLAQLTVAGDSDLASAFRRAFPPP